MRSGWSFFSQSRVSGCGSSRASTTPTLPAAEVKHTQVTFVGNVRGIAFSPDGRTAAYATTGADGRVMVRDIAGGQALEIWRGDIVVELQWLPDGSSVVVSGIQNDKLGLWVVPRLGGPARSLPTRGAHLAVSPDGQHLALAMQNEQGFRIFPLAGGAAEAVKMEGFRWLLGLDWGARSNRVAVLTQADDGTSTVWTIAPDGSDKRRLHTEKNLASIRWSPIDNVVYAIRARNEVAEVIRIPDRENGGEPEAILTGLPWDSADPYQRQGSLSTDGRRMLFVQGLRVCQPLEPAGRDRTDADAHHARHVALRSTTSLARRQVDCDLARHGNEIRHRQNSDDWW